MPCGKKNTVRSWDQPRKIPRITASKYEQNEPSVKLHWKNLMKDLEEHYKDEKFWESQSEVVRGLVGKKIFKRLQKIFDLPQDKEAYEPPPSPEPSVVPSIEFYVERKSSAMTQASAAEGSHYSGMSDVQSMGDLEEKQQLEKEATKGESEVQKEGSSDLWTITSSTVSEHRSKSVIISKTYLSFSKKSVEKSQRSASKSQMFSIESEPDSECSSDDDLIVHCENEHLRSHKKKKKKMNPHYQLLYCNESETDMIRWKSHYKQKTYDLSASDEFSKKAELITKQICNSFFEWWTGIGVYEFKSEIKRPEDIEALFQVWFEEHASRGLVLHPKILPCVLEHIAEAAHAPHASCRAVLKREIKSDIYAETKPAHTMAFGLSLPHKMKHIPPNNNSLEVWKPFPTPEDLRSMAYVWDDIKHLTSTKAFCAWLKENPQLPMPDCFTQEGEGKALFAQPSDYYLAGETSMHDLALPVSQISVELKTVLSQLMI